MNITMTWGDIALSFGVGIGGMRGGSSLLQIGQAMPAAPQPQAVGPSQGRSG